MQDREDAAVPHSPRFSGDVEVHNVTGAFSWPPHCFRVHNVCVLPQTHKDSRLYLIGGRTGGRVVNRRF